MERLEVSARRSLAAGRHQWAALVASEVVGLAVPVMRGIPLPVARAREPQRLLRVGTDVLRFSAAVACPEEHE